MSITASEMGKKRWANVSKEQHSALTSAAGKKRWEDVSPEEKSKIMKARRLKGLEAKGKTSERRCFLNALLHHAAHNPLIEGRRYPYTITRDQHGFSTKSRIATKSDIAEVQQAIKDCAWSRFEPKEKQ